MGDAVRILLSSYDSSLNFSQLPCGMTIPRVHSAISFAPLFLTSEDCLK